MALFTIPIVSELLAHYYHDRGLIWDVLGSGLPEFLKSQTNFSVSTLIQKTFRVDKSLTPPPHLKVITITVNHHELIVR